MDTALWMRRLLIILVCLWMTVMVLMPLFQLLLRSMVNPQGEFVGLANYAHYFKTPSLSRSLVRSGLANSPWAFGIIGLPARAEADMPPFSTASA